MKIERVMRIAKAVRKAADQLVKEGDYGMACGSDLGGACGDCTVVLWRMLGKRNCVMVSGYFKSSGYYDDGHCWVKLSDGQVLDVTATQFGKYPKVYLVPKGRRQAKYRTEKIYRSVTLDVGWGDTDWRRRVKARAEKLLKEAR